MEALHEIGCEGGVLFQRPVSAAEFSQFLRRWPTRRREFGFVTVGEAEHIDALYSITSTASRNKRTAAWFRSTRQASSPIRYNPHERIAFPE